MKHLGFDQSLGNCAELNDDTMYPEADDDLGAEDAKAVCNDGHLAGGEVCPVREDCLLYALTAGERYGVWGGKSERELSALRAQQTRRAVVSQMRRAS